MMNDGARWEASQTGHEVPYHPIKEYIALLIDITEQRLILEDMQQSMIVKMTEFLRMHRELGDWMLDDRAILGAALARDRAGPKRGE